MPGTGLQPLRTPKFLNFYAMQHGAFFTATPAPVIPSEARNLLLTLRLDHATGAAWSALACQRYARSAFHQTVILGRAIGAPKDLKPDSLPDPTWSSRNHTPAHLHPCT